MPGTLAQERKTMMKSNLLTASLAVLVIHVLGVAPQASAGRPYTNDFEGSVGSEWSHTKTEITPIGGRRFLGQFSNDTVRLTLTNLPHHTLLTITFDLFIIRSWDGNGDYCCAGPTGKEGDIWRLEVADGPVLLNTTFSNTGFHGNRQAYPDFFPGGSNTAQTGAGEVNTLGYLFGEAQTPEDAVYRLCFTLLHSLEAIEFRFSAVGLEPILTVETESWGLDNVVISTLDLAMVNPPGDVNSDSKVTGADSLLVNQALVGLRSYMVTEILPGSHSSNETTAVTIYGIAFPTNTVPTVTIGAPVNLTLTNVVVHNREQITATVPPGGGLGTGTVNVIYGTTNGVVSFGKFINQ
jgi:hypothetical protein